MDKETGDNNLKKTVDTTGQQDFKIYEFDFISYFIVVVGAYCPPLVKWYLRYPMFKQKSNF